MRILVTNDDGIFADGLWVLARELKNIAPVVVVAPDKEQSAIGTAVTLGRPLRVRKVRTPVPGIEAYSVKGTPADSVILALEKLVKNGVDLVVSGINRGLNLGNDVLISGTIGAALQGYLRGFPALAVSVPRVDNPPLDDMAKVAAAIAEKILCNALPSNIFLNINLPDLPLDEIGEVKITRLASESHIDTVEEGHDGRRRYYYMVRQEVNSNADEMTDVRVIEQGNISITPLHSYLNNNSSLPAADNLYSGILKELRKNQGQ